VTKLRWQSLGGGERIAVVADVDQCTSRVVLVRPDEPPFLHRVSTLNEAEPPVRRFVIECPCCGAEQVISLFADGSWTVEKFNDTS
jgi:hypothetical protein